MGYKYRIHSITGESNIWADLLSRWGRSKTICAMFHVPMVVPFQSTEFRWPDMREVKGIQEGALMGDVEDGIEDLKSDIEGI